MTKTLLTIIIFFFTIIFNASAQQKDLKKITDSIETEGKLLYASEWASWHGGDIFHAKYPSKKGQIRGFMSYDTGKGMVNIFYGEGEAPAVLGSVNFGYERDNTKYQADTVARKMNNKELELFKIRYAAIQRMNTDTIFKHYNNADLNPIPMIINGEKRVYVLTGPRVSGVVLIGNDYLLRFDKNDQIRVIEKQHKGLIPIAMRSNDGKLSIASIHNHLPEYSPFMTATDICTLMLYEKMTTWNQHVATTKDYTSIWDCKNDKLTIMTTADWEKTDKLKGALGGPKN